MKLPFLDRTDEQKRLARALKANGGALAVVYGRRRCEKSTLIRRTVGGNDVYYLVQLSPELPSLLQKYLDLPGPKKLNIVLCGSSQRMMHGLVLDKAAPLYGRAVEILKIGPLKAGWIRQGLGLTDAMAVSAFSVWGGVPRYWEFASQFDTLEEGIRELILDRNGVLYDEPMRLLMDDMRSAVQPYSLLSVIGQGCSRMSEPL